ncbi:MAG TPA: hypothetical protein VJT31_38230 [Rugosimonospora sp.]|nr:hypothetical protein [Rugosimonospora sp.]
MIKKILTWLFGAFVLFFLAFRPTGAATVVRDIGGVLSRVATGLGDFLSSLVS